MATGTDVLHVEDNPGDIRLAQEAFRGTNSNVCLQVFADGLDGLACVAKQGANPAAARPDLILLDLNLSKRDSREVLKHIREDETSRTIPTVILTTSDAPSDISHSHHLHANSYLSKPLQLAKFASVVRPINEFWFENARLPQAG